VNRWTKGLNPEQIEAVNHNHGPLLILAGAGSGKTTVLVSRTGRLLDDKVCEPHELKVLTFTNKASKELKHRVEQKIGKLAKKVWAGTFHSFGLQILKEFHELAGLPQHFSILDQSDSQSLVKELLGDLSVPGKDKFAVGKILEIINQWRVNPKKTIVAEDEYLAVSEVLKPKYVRRLELLGAVDFEGLMLKPLDLLNTSEEVLKTIQERTRFLMVDEFQDTNALQMTLIEKLVRPLCNITVVGDDDQSIYGWRGAVIENILQFPKQFHNCQVIKLERNYRSSAEIVAVANSVIGKNEHRHGKILRSERVDVGPLPESFLCENEEQECDFVVQQVQHFTKQGYKNSDIAVLFRSNGQGSLLEGTLRRHRIPYKITGGSTLLDRKEVKDALAYLRCGFEPTDLALKRILNTPPRGLGEVSLEALAKYADELVKESAKKSGQKTLKNSFLLALEAAASDPKKVGLPDKTGENIKEFLGLLRGIEDHLIYGSGEGATGSVGELFESFLRAIGYRDYVIRSSSESESGEKKWIVVEILVRILNGFIEKGARERGTILEFLWSMELKDVDTGDDQADEVQLLTMHASKGLEYPVVIIIGVEEDLIPHKTLGGDLAEERRLFYVALTRAKKHLLISRCTDRLRHGRHQPVTPSRFLVEIPEPQIASYNSIFRPVSGEARVDLVKDFMAKLKNKVDG
jgi:DNA helicase-2/ATP-dependent DNA helicase PcrA